MRNGQLAIWFWAVVTGVVVSTYAAFWLYWPWPKAVIIGFLAGLLTLILSVVFGERHADAPPVRAPAPAPPLPAPQPDASPAPIESAAEPVTFTSARAAAEPEAEPEAAAPPRKRATTTAATAAPRPPKNRGGQPKSGDPRTQPRAKAAKAPAPAKAEAEPAPAAAEKPAKKPRAPKAAAPAPAPVNDDLKQIKGIGPKIERALHEMGITSFAQIAAWTAEDVKSYDDRIIGPARIEYDDWVGQAKLLAQGGTTVFASRVKKGEVY